jgi:hypothetical protein
MQVTRKATGHSPPPRGGGAAMNGRRMHGKRQAKRAAAGGVLREAVATKHNSIPTTNKTRSLWTGHAEACLDGHPQYSPRRPSLPLRMCTLATVFHRAAPPSRRGANACAPPILQHFSQQSHGDHPHPPHSPKNLSDQYSPLPLFRSLHPSSVPNSRYQGKPSQFQTFFLPIPLMNIPPASLD